MSFRELDNLVSVVTPAYNCKDYIEGCIKSVASQSVTVKEHIIVDDGSNDGTSEFLDELACKYSKVVVMHQTNLGAGAARNRAIEVASGRYIAFLDSDDEWLPDKLANQIEYMESNTLAFTYGDYYRKCSISGEETLKVCPSSISYEQLLVKCPIGCLTVAYNQEMVGKVYMSRVRQGQDWSLWLKIASSGHVLIKYPGSFAIYNVIAGSLSKNKFKKLINVYRVYKELGLGRLSSLYYLFLHVINILRGK